MPPNLQADKIHLALFIILLGALLALGVRIRGPRLISFLLITAMGLSYTRGLVMFFLLVPILLARPLSEAHPFLREGRLTKDLFGPADKVIGFTSRHGKRLLAAFALAASVAASSVLVRRDIEPSQEIAPSAALDFVRQANIDGNVFNDYNFGGFLIWKGIPTFVDGRALPFGDDFLNTYFEASSVADLNKTFELLDSYNIKWTLVSPHEPIAKALAANSEWTVAYSDKYAAVFVRTHDD